MIKYNLEIRPAIPIEMRHKIADFLTKEGYNVWSQGQFTDGSVCDINFEDKKTAQDKFFKEEIKVSHILPGGMGSGKKTDPILIEPLCSICNEIQFETPSGICCKNGHGGAPLIEDES